MPVSCLLLAFRLFRASLSGDRGARSPDASAGPGRGPCRTRLGGSEPRSSSARGGLVGTCPGSAACRALFWAWSGEDPGRPRAQVWSEWLGGDSSSGDTQPSWGWVGARETVIFGVFLLFLRWLVLAPSRKRFSAVSFLKTVFAVALHVNSVKDSHASATQSSCQIRC